MSMTSRARLLTAIKRGVPDRLPVTTHHVMPSFLDRYMGGASNLEFFGAFDLDAIHWTRPLKADGSKGQRLVEYQTGMHWHSTEVVTDHWRIEAEELADQNYPTRRFRVVTPKGTLTTTLQFNEHTSWVTEYLVKDKTDIDLIAEFMPSVSCDAEAMNQEATAFGERGIVRSEILPFALFGQPGCWQDAACLVGIEKLIFATFDDPRWIHELLKILQRRKEEYIRSLGGARYDILELGGGDASTTVISPAIFRTFVAPYDGELIALTHEMGQRIVYHTCGGMMPILEDIADMGPDAMETFTPPEMGGDVDLAEAKRRTRPIRSFLRRRPCPHL